GATTERRWPRMGLADQLSDALSGHADEIKAGIEKAGDLVDEKTGGKFASQVDQVQEKLEGLLGKKD
ncbi:MAG: antitoxin, partial [Propionibacteriaceae bacterium]|nr:antitoxin [Propionibacteriaceae bacterium]